MTLAAIWPAVPRKERHRMSQARLRGERLIEEDSKSDEGLSNPKGPSQCRNQSKPPFVSRATSYIARALRPLSPAHCAEAREIADGRTRTGTGVLSPTDFKSVASAISPHRLRPDFSRHDRNDQKLF